MDNTTDGQTRTHVSLFEIAKLFLLIGTTGFGGGIAIIALMQEYCVFRKRWLTLEEFSHGVAFGQILGPFAVNTSIFVGYRLRGVKGAAVAVVSFLAPSVVLVMVLTELYLRYQRVPSLKSALAGIGPVVVALIVAAAYRMGRGKMRSLEPIALFALSVVAVGFFNLPIILVLLGTLAYALTRTQFERRSTDE